MQTCVASALGHSLGHPFTFGVILLVVRRILRDGHSCRGILMVGKWKRENPCAWTRRVFGIWVLLVTQQTNDSRYLWSCRACQGKNLLWHRSLETPTFGLCLNTFSRGYKRKRFSKPPLKGCLCSCLEELGVSIHFTLNVFPCFLWFLESREPDGDAVVGRMCGNVSSRYIQQALGQSPEFANKLNAWLSKA